MQRSLRRMVYEKTAVEVMQFDGSMHFHLKFLDHTQQINLQKKCSFSLLQINVIFKNFHELAIKTINSEELVPGDLVIIHRTGNRNSWESGIPISCDVVLLNGECVMQEATLTGENVPVIKTGLPKTDGATSENSDRSCNMFSFQNHSRHVLFAGTKIIQCTFQSEHMKALVIRTG